MFDITFGLEDRVCRAKRRDNFEWIVGYHLCVNGKHYIVERESEEILHLSPSSSLIKAVPVLSDTVGPYTFASDAYGHDIYSDDVIETVTSSPSPFSNANPGLVVFDHGLCYADGFIEIDLDEFKYCRIIGNIHDSPELLDLFPELETNEPE